MATSNFPYGFAYGVSIRNLPLLNTYSGNVFWVDSANGTASDGNPGTFVRPFATINGAIAQCTAANGDIVMVGAGHAEVMTAAGGIALSKSGVQVIGVGNGRSRPSITYTTANTASITVTAANCAFINFTINATGFAAVANPIKVTAADCLIQGCEFVLTSAVNQAGLGILTTAAADGLIVDGNRFVGTTDAGTATAVQIVGGDRIQITNNFMQGAYTLGIGGINNVTTACTNAQIAGNFINNVTANSTKAMVFVAGSSGIISNNRMQILSGTAPITGAGMSWVGGNYYAATIATAGTLI